MCKDSAPTGLASNPVPRFTRQKRDIILLLLACHLGIIVVINIDSLYIALHDLYFKESKPNELFAPFNRLANTRIVKTYTSVSGTDTGYGFFAPNVSSQFVTVFTKTNLQNEVIEVSYNPSFQGKEGLIRYCTALSIFMDELEEKNHSDTTYRKLLNVILHSIADKVAGRGSTRESAIQAELYLYDYPSLKQSVVHPRGPKFILIKKIQMHAN